MPQLIFFLILISLGFFIGGWSERRHYRRLEAREQATRGFVATQVKSFLQPSPQGKPPLLIVSEVVIASDYFKTFAAGLRNLFGGEVKSFERMLDRARREALLRLVEQAQSHGYNAICNLRMNTASVGGMSRKANAMASIIAWATAYDTSIAAPTARPNVPPLPRDPGLRA